MTVSHVPRAISAVCSLFLDHGGTITSEVIGNRQYLEDLSQGGLEIPCELSFHGPSKYIPKICNLLDSAKIGKLDSWCVKNVEEQKVAISIVDSEGESGDTRDGIWLEVDDHRLLAWTELSCCKIG